MPDCLVAELLGHVSLGMYLFSFSQSRFSIVKRIFSYGAWLIRYRVNMWQYSLAETVCYVWVFHNALSLSIFHHLFQVSFEEDRRLAFISHAIDVAAGRFGRWRQGAYSILLEYLIVFGHDFSIAFVALSLDLVWVQVQVVYRHHVRFRWPHESEHLEVGLLCGRCACAELWASSGCATALVCLDLLVLLHVDTMWSLIKLSRCMLALTCGLAAWLILCIFERQLVDDLLSIGAKIHPVVQATCRLFFLIWLEHFHGFLASVIRVHLLKLLDRLWNNFVYLEQEEGILAKKLASIIFVFIVVHQMVIVWVNASYVGWHA